MEIVGISVDSENKLIYYDNNNLKLKKNITVVIETERGLELGTVATNIHPIDSNHLNQLPPKILRIASKKDYLNYKNNKKKAIEALTMCKKLVKKYHLKMNIMDAIYTLNNDQLIFHFTADSRIDFRELAKELASIYKTRIELRQIGVRDKAKRVCGYGSCGQKLCCSRFLNQFNSVSISMAKNQNLSLNPNKINGVCGRLLCCLRYEDEAYKELKKGIPEVGKIVKIKEGQGKVISNDILRRRYTVEIYEKGQIEVQL